MFFGRHCDDVVSLLELEERYHVIRHELGSHRATYQGGELLLADRYILFNLNHT